jgi:hypothetical protein
MTLLPFERRWAGALLEAFAPPGGPGLAPEPGEVDYVAGMQRMLGSFTKRAALGLRAALWIGALAPIWMGARLSSIARVPLARRTEIVQRLLVHRLFLVRELMFLLKTVASFALLGTPSVRERSNYDRGVQPVWPERPTPRHALPTVPAEAPVGARLKEVL